MKVIFTYIFRILILYILFYCFSIFFVIMNPPNEGFFNIIYGFLNNIDNLPIDVSEITDLNTRKILQNINVLLWLNIAYLIYLSLKYLFNKNYKIDFKNKFDSEKKEKLIYYFVNISTVIITIRLIFNYVFYDIMIDVFTAFELQFLLFFYYIYIYLFESFVIPILNIVILKQSNIDFGKIQKYY